MAGRRRAVHHVPRAPARLPLRSSARSQAAASRSPSTRRGFAEITVVATLCTLLLLRLERHAERGRREAVARARAGLLVAQLKLLLVSAFRRIGLYEGAYGFTTARLYAQAYMVVMAVGIGLLAADLARTRWRMRPAREARSGLLGALAVIALSFWYHEAWIVRATLVPCRDGADSDLPRARPNLNE